MGISTYSGVGRHRERSPDDDAGGGSSSNGSEGGEGNGGAGEGGSNAPGAGTLDRGKLNPLLRGMPEEQLNEVFDALMSAARKKDQAPDMSGVPSHARPAQREEPAAPKMPTRDQFKEMLDPNHENFNPEVAFKAVVEANYGGLINDIGRNATAGIKGELRRQLPDFDKYEADIDTVLAGSGNVSQAQMVDTYFRVKGLRQTQEEIAARQKPPVTAPPSPRKEQATEPAMSSEDIEVAKVMFRGSADPIAEYKKAQQMMDAQHIRVPGDPKPKAKA